MLDTLGYLRGNGIVDHLVDDGRSLGSPLLRSHWLVRDDVVAEHVLDVLHVAPVLGITVLQPDECCTNIGWNVLGVVNNNRLFAPGRHENFHSRIVIAVGPFVQRSLDTSAAPETDIDQRRIGMDEQQFYWRRPTPQSSVHIHAEGLDPKPI
jgi:hypothetical protein